MSRNICLLVAFDGTDFHGWQRQPGVRTVQDVLEQAIRRTVRHQVDVTGSGRTDAGVHAAGHVNNFLTSSTLSPSRLRYAIGARLPKDISIIALRDVHPEFNATQSAISKLYRYRIFAARHRPVESFVHRYTYHFWEPLDVDRMREAGAHMVGTMDFTSMAARGTERESMVRTVLHYDVQRRCDEVQIDVVGTGFLWKQVRTMVGTLINVGRGHWKPADVAEILEARDRTKAGPTAAARGLCLQWVRYPPHLLTPIDNPPSDTDDLSVLASPS